jgi:DNA-binding IclR family transcriptional regulator
MIEQTRKENYAFNDGRIVRGMCAVGVPVLGRHGSPVASLSVAAIKDRMQPPRVHTIVTWLSAEAKLLEEPIAKLTIGVSENTVERLFGRER